MLLNVATTYSFYDFSSIIPIINILVLNVTDAFIKINTSSMQLKSSKAYSSNIPTDRQTDLNQKAFSWESNTFIMVRKLESIAETGE